MPNQYTKLYYKCREHGRVKALYAWYWKEQKFYPYCRFCNRLNNLVWRMKPKNAETMRRRAREWYAANREHAIEAIRQRRIREREAVGIVLICGQDSRFGDGSARHTHSRTCWGVLGGQARSLQSVEIHGS